MKKSEVKFNKKALAKDIFNNLALQQTALFVEYAKNKVRLLGDAIMLYNSRNHMDRTGNLINSLCWGVSYQGKLQEGGFYREPPVLRDKGIAGTSESFLHEWFAGDVKYLLPVDGHALAEEYLQTYGNNGSRGWKVFFAILAPYWGYWEKGFNMKSKFGTSTKFMQFAVMTEFFDEVRKDLKPARTRFRTSVPKYNRAKLEAKWQKYNTSLNRYRNG